jgi:PAS domain S-box-containing protein
MKKEWSVDELLSINEALMIRLEESEQLIEAIKAGEVDAFALNRNNKPEIFTLESGDHSYRMLVENFNEGALTLSEDGLIVYTNSYFHGLLDLPYTEAIGKPIFSFIQPDSAAAFDTIFNNALNGQSKGEIILSSGTKNIPVYVSLTSLSNTPSIVGMVVTDLTERKIFEQQIEEKAKQLEIKNVELQKMNKDLESFAYISSHDLQEPLRKIQLFASRINDEENQNLSASGKNMFSRMQLAAKRMQTLIDDLLTYSRSNSNKAIKDFEIVSLNTIMDEVKDDLKEEIEEKNAAFEADDLCDAKVIPFQFRQMMHNLIGNALKFSDPSNPPHIKIECEELPSFPPFNYKKACHITVLDNGIGFEQHYSDKIFQVFQRLHERSEYKGTGIGLAIVKKIVENHDGIITATSEPSKGARFDIYIPGI